MHKLASLSSYTWNKLNEAIRHERDLNKVMINLGNHFKIPQDDAAVLFNLKQKQFPKTKFIMINENNKRFTPAYLPKENIVVSYKEPWSFMHEYGHAYERSDLADKIRRLLPIKHKLNTKQRKLLEDYINEAYMSGDEKSKAVGNYLKNVIEDAQKRKEADVWRLTEELRANARAYNETNKVVGKENATKIMQPLSISDVSYVGHFYPDEMSKLLNTQKKPVIEKIKNLNLLEKIKNKLNKIEEGMPEEWEQFRT